MAWLLLNVPAVVLFVVVVVKHAATSGELFRNAVAVALWAVISGIGVAVVCLTGLIALEAVGRYAAVRRKRRFHRG